MYISFQVAFTALLIKSMELENGHIIYILESMSGNIPARSSLNTMIDANENRGIIWQTGTISEASLEPSHSRYI